MTYPAPARTTRRSPGLLVAGLLVVFSAIIGTQVHRPASSSASSFTETPSLGTHVAVPQPPVSSAPAFDDVVRRDRHARATAPGGAVTEDDGVLPDRVTVFDREYPGVANLDPDLLAALRKAAMDAAEDGVELYVNSGWRSPAFQDQLFRAAVREYGSEEVAARWVATPDTSAHVSGDAVDIGPGDATAWLVAHGATYGLCQIYRNEPWHFELRPVAVDDGCPAIYADPRHDPRMQQ